MSTGYLAHALTAVLALGAPVCAQAQAAPIASADRPTRPVLQWTPAEQARWYKAMEQVLPTRVVPRGPTVRALPAGGPIDPRVTVAGRTWTVDDWMRETRVSGVIVMRDGKILLERYGLGRGPQDRWTSFSVAKSVTALLAGAAVQDGKLRLDDRVVTHVPELKGSAYDGVTVRHLLTMSSGVRWNEDYSDPDSHNSRLSRDAKPGEDRLLTTLAKLPRLHPPGTKWHYNTAETHLAGLVVARATGRTLSDYLSEKIWKPYGMEQDAAWIVDGRGREAAGCCLSATLRDFTRIGQFALDGGVIDGRPVLPPGFVDEATSVRIANDQPAPSGYGYFWWIGARAYEASGIFGQSILVYPKERIVIAINSAWAHPDAKEQWRAMSMFQGAAHDAAAPDFPPTIER